MPCDITRNGDIITVACSRGRRSAARNCQFCGITLYAGGKLCDFQLQVGERTCDAFMCQKCATRVGPNRDYCPNHREQVNATAGG